MPAFLYRFCNDEAGATSIEYSLIGAFIGLVIIAAAYNVGAELILTFNAVEQGFK